MSAALPIDTSDPAVVERFWAKVARSGDCRNWTAYLNAKGYGMFRVSGRVVLAHRFAYELLVGPIPEGLELDHLCRNRACVNPAHVEPVTHAVNVLRGVSPTAMHARKTECPQGHPYGGANLYLRPGDRRACRECHRVHSRARRVAALARIIAALEQS